MYAGLRFGHGRPAEGEGSPGVPERVGTAGRGLVGANRNAALRGEAIKMIRHGRTHPGSPWARAVIFFAFWAQASAILAAPVDTLDPLLSRLSSWVDREVASSYGYTAVASGAALAIGYRADSGYHLPAPLKLLWPGNVALLADSTYVAVPPPSVASAQLALVTALKQGGGALLITPDPVLVYGVDSSFGEPWFLVARGGTVSADSAMWDAGDLKRYWWRWSDEPGANTIWPLPQQARAPRGRKAILEGLRHCVLAARPQAGETATGLAVYDVVPVRPGPPAELVRLAVIRTSAARFLQHELELWPPAERERVLLVVYYLEKAAQAWRGLAERAPDWELTSAQRKEDLLSALSANETSAALALDALVSPRQ